LSCVSGIHWQDLDNDTDFDVAFSIQAGNPSDQRLFVNNSGQFTESFTGLSMSSTGVRALDSDLDGKQDLLFLPAENTDTPRLLKNNTEGSNIQVADVTSSVGLNTVGRVDGAVVSDFNAHDGVSGSDGDMDIYLGRPETEEFFFRASNPDGSNEPINKFVAIQLGTSGANNASAIGTKVSIEYDSGSITQIQQFDGGSGRGGQDDHILTFGLGSYGGDVEVTIEWPGGYLQQEVISASQITPSPENPFQFFDATNPQIQSGSLYVSYAIQAGDGLLEWTLVWDTDVSSEWARDKVRITGPGDVGIIFASPMYGNAEVTITSKTGGGYNHTLKVPNVECQPGIYEFRVYSSTSLQAGTHLDTSKNIRFCPTN